MRGETNSEKVFDDVGDVDEADEADDVVVEEYDEVEIYWTKSKY